jgi:hypothetical protein
MTNKKRKKKNNKKNNKRKRGARPCASHCFARTVVHGALSVIASIKRSLHIAKKSRVHCSIHPSKPQTAHALLIAHGPLWAMARAASESGGREIC